jgi:hypothetical protein
VPLITTLVPLVAAGSSTFTFARNYVAYVSDFEGILRTVQYNEARFQGARRVQNNAWIADGYKSEAFGFTGTGTTPPVGVASVAYGGKTNASSLTFAAGVSGAAESLGTTYSSTPGYAFPNTNSTASYPGRQIRLSASMAFSRPLTGTEAIEFSGRGAAVYPALLTFTAAFQPTAAFQRFAGPVMASDDLSGFAFHPTVALTSPLTIYVWGLQCDDVTGAANQSPSEYVSVGMLAAPFHGAGVDRVKYFTTTNGNSVVNSVVVDGVGAAIPLATLFGYSCERTRTNQCLYSQDFTNASWVKTALAVVLNTAAAPDALTTADSLTASAGNATAQQAITSGSSEHTFSIYLRRLTGSGPVLISLDGFVTSQAVTLTSAWQRFVRSQTLANPTVGVRIGTSGDAIHAWGAQCESLPPVSSYITTLSAPVARPQDVLSYAAAGNFDNTTGTFYMEAVLDDFYSYRYVLESDTGQSGVYFTGSAFKTYDGTTDLTFVGLSGTLNVSMKLANRWGVDQKGALDGVLSTNTGAFDGSFGFTTKLNVGGLTLDGCQARLRNLKIYPDATDNAGLIAMTAP